MTLWTKIFNLCPSLTAGCWPDQWIPYRPHHGLEGWPGPCKEDLSGQALEKDWMIYNSGHQLIMEMGFVRCQGSSWSSKLSMSALMGVHRIPTCRWARWVELCSLTEHPALFPTPHISLCPRWMESLGFRMCLRSRTANLLL